MRFLPIYRWQGGLVGSYVGQWFPKSRTAQTVLPYLQIGQHLIQVLGEKGQVFEQDWLNLYQQYSNELKSSRSGDIILALLPLILFEHDSRREFEQYLDSIKTFWQQRSETIEDLLVWGDLCSLILTEQFQPEHGLAHLRQVPQIQQTSLKQLELVQKLLNNAVPLRQGMKHLIAQSTPNQLPILLSLYCFLSTPDHFHLSVLRAIQFQQSSLILALTGFLSGIYNTTSGFPIFWRIAAQNYSLTSWLEKKTVQMFANWSGVYDFNSESSLFKSSLASSGVIQRRSSLNLVSQDQL